MKPTFPLIFLSAIALLTSCTRAGQITIVNRSTSELTNVVATRTGFSQAVWSIPAGDQRPISVIPQGESDLQLNFNANGKHFSSEPQGYFEKGYGYKVTATVSPDFIVTVDTTR